MRSELIVKFQFEASHSLAGYEAPHSHIWLVEAAIGGDVLHGKIVDMVELRKQFEQHLDPLKNTYLNDHPGVGEVVRKAPTCESLGYFLNEHFQRVLEVHFSNENPSIYLASVMVTICSMDGVEMGGVRMSNY